MPSAESQPQSVEGQQPEQPKITSTSKLQAQVTQNPAHNMVILEHEYNGEDFSVCLKGVNVNPFDVPSQSSKAFSSVTGIFSASYLQSVSKNLALGVEWTVSRPQPTISETASSFALRWAPPASPLPAPLSLPEGAQSPYMPINPKDPTQVFTSSFAPSSGMLHSTYWRRLNQRLEVTAELQMLLMPSSAGRPGRREGIPKKMTILQ